MSTSPADPGSGQRRGTSFGEAEGQELASLFRSWREESGLAAAEERRFAVLLKGLVESRAAGPGDAEAILRLVEPFAGPVELSEDEKRSLIRRVKPLLETRELTKDEKEELAALFERYQMRLTSKLRRSIGAALQAEFEPGDVLNDAYIRAETRWFARPADPARHYVWIYGIVHDQLTDMLRKVNAVKRGGRINEVSMPDNSAAEIALEFWRSQTGASTIAERNELVSRLRGFLERKLSPADREIVLMRVLDRLEYPRSSPSSSAGPRERATAPPTTGRFWPSSTPGPRRASIPGTATARTRTGDGRTPSASASRVRSGNSRVPSSPSSPSSSMHSPT